MLCLAALVVALAPAARAQAAQQASPCLTDPSQPQCATYVYPAASIEQDIDSNCQAMPWMVGCSVRRACAEGRLPSGSPYCAPFSVLATSCVDAHMDGMRGCLSYIALCSRDSAVPQCSEHLPIPRVVHTMASQEAVLASCADHNMPGCETCTAEFDECPDTLAALSKVCLAHRMEACAQFYTMCDSAGADLAHFCDSRTASYDPPMRMYFHNGIRDIVLFRGLVPNTGGEYAGVIIGCLLLGVLATFLRTLRGVCESRERILRSQLVREHTGAMADQRLFALPASEAPAHLGRTALSFVVIVLDYALMLLAMTFNVGIFFAVCAGLALGLLLFSHVGRRYTERLQARSMLAASKCPCGSASDTSLVGLKRASGSDLASEPPRKCAGPQAGGTCGARAHRDRAGVCCDAHTADALEEAAKPAPNTLPDCCS